MSTHTEKNHYKCHLPHRQYFKGSLKRNRCPCLFSTFYRGTYGTGKYWFFSSHSDIVIPDITPELILVRSSLFHQLSCVFWNTCISVSDPACDWWRTMTFCLLMAATGHRIRWVQSISSQRCPSECRTVEMHRLCELLWGYLTLFQNENAEFWMLWHLGAKVFLYLCIYPFCT